MQPTRSSSSEPQLSRICCPRGDQRCQERYWLAWNHLWIESLAKFRRLELRRNITLLNWCNVSISLYLCKMTCFLNFERSITSIFVTELIHCGLFLPMLDTARTRTNSGG